MTVGLNNRNRSASFCAIEVIGRKTRRLSGRRSFSGDLRLDGHLGTGRDKRRMDASLGVTRQDRLAPWSFDGAVGRVDRPPEGAVQRVVKAARGSGRAVRHEDCRKALGGGANAFQRIAQRTLSAAVASNVVDRELGIGEPELFADQVGDGFGFGLAGGDIGTVTVEVHQ